LYSISTTCVFQTIPSTSKGTTSARLRFQRRIKALSQTAFRYICSVRQRDFDNIALAANWTPPCLFWDLTSEHASEATGTHTHLMSTLMEMLLHHCLAYPEGNLDVSMTGWFAVWSNRFELGTLAHACNDTFSKCLKIGDASDEEHQRLIRGIILDMVRCTSPYQ